MRVRKEVLPVGGFYGDGCVQVGFEGGFFGGGFSERVRLRG